MSTVNYSNPATTLVKVNKAGVEAGSWVAEHPVISTVVATGAGAGAGAVIGKGVGSKIGFKVAEDAFYKKAEKAFVKRMQNDPTLKSCAAGTGKTAEEMAKMAKDIIREQVGEISSSLKEALKKGDKIEGVAKVMNRVKNKVQNKCVKLGAIIGATLLGGVILLKGLSTSKKD